MLVLKYSISSKSKFICQDQILSRLIILSHVEFMGDTCVYIIKNFHCRHSKKEEAERSSFFAVDEGYAHTAV